MKRLFYALLIICFVASCKKEIHKDHFNGDYLENVKTGLQDSLSFNELSSLDFTHAIILKAEKQHLYFFRIPYIGKKFSQDFLIVKTNAKGKIEAGKIIHIQKDQQNLMPQQWNGSIMISSLDRKKVLQSSIEKGYITAFHPRFYSRTSLMEDNVLPEVVVVAYVYNYSNDFSTWLWLSSLFYDSGTGGGGYYGSMDGGGGYTDGYYGGGGGGYTGSGDSYSGDGTNIPSENLIEFEPEYIFNKPGIDVWKYFNCFDNVPSLGATYTIKLCADIPSNTNPQASSPSSGSSAGHSFLVVTKQNGDAKVTQSFGFYPQSEPSILDPFGSVTSTIKDNGGNEYNAAIEMTISESQFNLVKNNAISWSTKPYNLGDYNCTNYAMDVFNSVRQTPISISPYKIILPGDPNPYVPSEPNTVVIEKTPQMLFVKLQEMKSNNEPEAAKIEIDQSHNSLSPVSHGACS